MPRSPWQSTRQTHFVRRFPDGVYRLKPVEGRWALFFIPKGQRAPGHLLAFDLTLRGAELTLHDHRTRTPRQRRDGLGTFN